MLFSLNGIETIDFFEFREWSNLNFPVHCHYSFEVIFVTSGSILLRKENAAYNLSSGDACVIMPLEIHSFITEGASEVFIFQIAPSLISNWDCCFAGKTLKEPCRGFSDPVLHDIHYALKNTTGSLVDLNYIFFKIMHLFLYENELVNGYELDDICLKALRYIGDNFSKNITLKDMAADFNISYVYLSRVFAKKLKFKFVDCVNSFRIQKAISLLSDPNRNISEICYECGFGSLRQFNRFFKETMSCSPREYRKMHLVHNATGRFKKHAK